MDFKKNQNLIIIIAAVVVLLIGGLMFLNSKKQNSKNPGEAFPTEAVIPTVDSSVIVNLTQAKKKGEVLLTIKNAPSGTKSVNYELSYEAAGEGGDEGESGTVQQGAIGTCDFKGGKKECEKEVTLGTCSSGTCRYHKVIGKIHVSLKFNGSYGERAFEKDFAI